VASGFWHDTCSAVHPLAVASPFFRAFGLTKRVEFVTPEISFAHPLLRGDGSGPAAARASPTATSTAPSKASTRRRRLPTPHRPLAAHARRGRPVHGVDAPARATASVRHGPLRHPRLAQGSPLWNAGFTGDVGPAMITGVAAHAIVRQPSLVAAAAGLALQTHAHAGGWPIPLGGSQAISDALAVDLVAHGGEIVTDHEVTSLDELTARAVVLDVTPRALIRLAGARTPAGYRRRLERFRYGSGAAKVQFALSGPVPWADERCGMPGPSTSAAPVRRSPRRSGRCSPGGTRHPYVLVSQPSRFDPSRAPGDAHALWTYTHVPAGSTLDQTEAVTRVIEQYAPGFRDLVIASRATRRAARGRQPELHRRRHRRGSGDAPAAPRPARAQPRPVAHADARRLPLRASTVPGPGVHGQSGWFAARSALQHEFGIRRTSLAP
jgi:phytoene dehydrogenase-like protein